MDSQFSGDGDSQPLIPERRRDPVEYPSYGSVLESETSSVSVRVDHLTASWTGEHNNAVLNGISFALDSVCRYKC